MNHTPAPWLVEYDRDENDSSQSTLRVIDSRSLDHPQGPLTIATINVAAHAPHMDEPLSNAGLIAAVPELLDLLYVVLPFIEDAKADPTYKPGYAAGVEKRIRAALRLAASVPEAA